MSQTAKPTSGGRAIALLKDILGSENAWRRKMCLDIMGRAKLSFEDSHQWCEYQKLLAQLQETATQPESE